jgi:energy-coupling factor transporter ATP-binding protein EcfA2
MEKLLIRNFKSIKNQAQVEIELAKLLVLMGEQASGKSTLAKLVYFFKTLKEEILNEIIENENLSDNTLDQAIILRTRRYFINMFGSTTHLSDFSLIYTIKSGLSASKNIDIKLSKGQRTGNLIVKFHKNIKDGIIKHILPLKNELKKSSSGFDEFSRRERELIIGKMAQVLNVIFISNNQSNLFMPASRNMTVMLEHHLTDIFFKLENSLARDLQLNASARFQSENEIIILKFLQYLRTVKSRFKNSGDFKSLIVDTKQYAPINERLLHIVIGKAETILKGRYGQDQYGEKIFFGSDSNSGYVYLNNASSGQQESIRILQDVFLGILDNNPVFRIYEEPESHLSPNGQQVLLEAISMLANINKLNQIIITTHSSYIIRVIDNLLKAKTIEKKKPFIKDDIGKIIEKEAWIDFDKINVYFLDSGEIKNAKNSEYKSIDAQLFDDVGEKISDQFDNLLNLQYDE